MKQDTRFFYEDIVRTAITRIADGLDEALNLTELAKLAALSPLHFHRIFRGMLGETPLELHRRLRLERAASRIASTDASITTIAFDAGYETHESFTRSFRAAYSLSPSEFRERSEEARRTATQAPSVVLAARSGIHVSRSIPSLHQLPYLQGDIRMNVEVTSMPDMRVATVSHIGPYNRISEAFERLGMLAGPAGLFAQPDAIMLAIYHDDPDTTPAEKLRSEAGVVVPAGVPLPSSLNEVHIPAGTYALTTHLGPYSQLGDTWARLMGDWLPKSGRRVGPGTAYEIYRNNPANAKPEDLHTDLFLSVT